MSLTPARIRENVERVRERIAAACARSGRDPSEVTLVCVTKGRSPEEIEAAFAAGVRDFGENRVQEARAKLPLLEAARSARWHLVGHLQRNKVRAALECFAILHGVDSARLVSAVAERAERPVEIFVQVNISGEPTKFGCRPEETPQLVEFARRHPNLQVSGLMTIAPHRAEPRAIRACFARLRELARELGLPKLSMGMSEDFELAVEEGATHVRIGRAIFEEVVR